MITCEKCGSHNAFIVRSTFGGGDVQETVVCKTCKQSLSQKPERRPPPEYYAQGGIEPWDVIRAWDLDFWQGNIAKYLCRAGKKKSEHPRKDYQKMIDYIRGCMRQLDD